LLRSAVLASGAAVAAVAVVLAVLVSTLAGQQESNRLVRRSESVLRTAATGERAIVDMETGLRGVVITRDRTFLQPYTKGVPTAQGAADSLLAQTRDDPIDRRIATRLRGEVSDYVTGYARPVLGLVAGNPAAARSEAITAEGKRRVDAMRADFTALANRERARLDRRTNAADRSADRAIAVAVGGLLVLLVVVAGFGAYVARRIARPVRGMTRAAEQMTAGDLSVRVPVGGAGELDRLAQAFNAMAESLAVAQEALRRRAVELEATGERTVALLDPVFEQAPVGLAVFDDQLRFVRVNATLAAMDGLAVDGHLGLPIGDVLPGMAGEIGARLRDALAERRTVTDAEVEGTTRVSPRDERIWRASYFPVVLPSGEAVGSGAMFVDVTERRRAARERQRLLTVERLAAQRTARLQEVTGRLSRAVAPGDVAQVVVEQGVAALGAAAGIAVLRAPRVNALELAAQAGLEERDVLDWRGLELSGATPLAEAMRTGRIVALADRAALRARYPARAEALERVGHGAWVAAPIGHGPDALAGALFAFATPRRLGDEELRLLDLILAQAAQALERATLYERQRHIASTLQRSLLPAHMPEIPGIELAAVYRPAGDGNEVGGDFYDVVPTRDGRFVVAIGDVQGKGPEAAALTGLVRHTLRAETLHEDDPAELIRRLNRVVYRDESDRFCTVALATVEPAGASARLRVACGGHLPPIVTRRDETPAEVACRGSLLGIQAEVSVRCEVVELWAGDGLVLYTDGVLDASAPASTLTADDLVALLAEVGDGAPEDVARAVHDAAVGRRVAGVPPRDDIAILALRVSPAPPAAPSAAAEPPSVEALG
jgi:serine phosphatase RsbU (regulator of sigma subunit)/CHASE3 domain sensor protein